LSEIVPVAPPKTLRDLFMGVFWIGAS